MPASRYPDWESFKFPAGPAADRYRTGFNQHRIDEIVPGQVVAFRLCFNTWRNSSPFGLERLRCNTGPLELLRGAAFDTEQSPQQMFDAKNFRGPCRCLILSRPPEALRPSGPGFEGIVGGGHGGGVG